MLRVRFVASVCRNMVSEIERMVKGVRLFRNRLPEVRSTPLMRKSSITLRKEAGQPILGSESVRVSKKDKREKLMKSSVKY